MYKRQAATLGTLVQHWGPAHHCGSGSPDQKKLNQLNSQAVEGKHLRLLDTNASEIAKNCNFWTFRLVIQLIKAAFQSPTKSLSAQWSIDVKSVVHFLHLWSIGRKAFLADFEKMVY